MMAGSACVLSYTNNLTTPLTFTVSNADSDIYPYIKAWPVSNWAGAKTNINLAFSVPDTYVVPSTGSLSIPSQQIFMVILVNTGSTAESAIISFTFAYSLKISMIVLLMCFYYLV